MTDRHLLYGAGLLRSVAVAATGILLGLYLPRAGLDAGEIGVVVALGLAGGAASVLAATLFAESLGRRRFLLLVAVLSAGGTAAAAFLEAPWALALVAFLGMLNGMGRDRGAASVIEQALLPSTTDDRGRTFVVARYTLLQDAGRSLGNLAAGVPGLLAAADVVEPIFALRGALLVCAAIQLPAVLFYARLSPGLAPPPARPARVTPETRATVGRLCALFALDAVGGGFLATTLLTVIFQERFGASDASVAGLFAASSLLNALSHIGAAWIAKRIGLVNTMVFTHIPGSLLLVTVAWAPSFPVAALLFLLREGLVEMDVPTRQSYVMAVVRPEERTFASGATSLVRVGGWAAGAWFAGMVLGRLGPGATLPLVLAAGTKITYDVLLWISFRKLKPPEEITPPASPPPARP